MPRSAPRTPRPAAAFGLLVVATALVNAAGAQEGPAPHVAKVFTPSDFPGLEEKGVRLAKGRYTVKVWAPKHQVWYLTSDGAVLTLNTRRNGDVDDPHWQTIGQAEVGGDAPIKVFGLGSRMKERFPVPALVVIAADPDYNPAPVLDLIRGRTDSVAPPADPRRTAARTNKEGADFRPPATAPEWRERAGAVREQLLVTMGLRPLPPRTPLRPRVFGKVERDGYTIEKVVLETFPGFTLSGNLYRPTGTAGKRPGILCPHGHAKEGRANADTQQRCVRWARLGCVVFLYDMVGYVDSQPFGHAFLNDRLRRWGLSLVTLQTWDSLRALDWLSTLPDVDPARIGCTGESGGATQTILLTAVDDRVKAAAPVVMVSDSFQGGCTCENCAGLRVGTDNVEIAALAAPRPLKLVGATGDWTALTMTRAYPALLQVYTLVGTADRVSADVFDFPHNYNKTSRNAVYPFLAKWLLGLDDPSATAEGDQLVETAADLQTFTDSTPRPAGLKTPAELEDYLIQTLRAELDALAPGESSPAWEASRALLKASLGVRVGLVNPPPAGIKATELRRVQRDGVTVVHALAGRKSVGENIPIVRLIPARATGRLTVIASAHGKAGLVAPAGRFAPLVRALLDRGQSVVGFDPLFVGESVDPSAPALRRPQVLHFDAYNPTLPADQMQDLATVLAWARAQPDVRAVGLIGQGRSGAQVLLARPLLEGLARTAVDLHGFSEGDGSSPIPPEVDLPGLLQFGGLKSAAALACPAPVWVARAPASFDRSWPEKAYALADSSHALRVDAGRPDVADVARWIDTGE